MDVVKFWIETPLNSVAQLVADYKDYASQDQDLSEMYEDDAKDFHKAISLFRQSDAEALAQHVQFMDTHPREALVVAFNKDLGNQFVESVLGYSVR